MARSIEERIEAIEASLGLTAAEEFRGMSDERLFDEVRAVELFLLRVEDEKHGDAEYQTIRRAYLRACAQRRDRGTPMPRPLHAAFLAARTPYTEQETIAGWRRRLALLHIEQRAGANETRGAA